MFILVWQRCAHHSERSGVRKRCHNTVSCHRCHTNVHIVISCTVTTTAATMLCSFSLSQCCVHQCLTTVGFLLCIYLSSAVNFVLGPMNVVLTVRDVVLRDPITIILSSLCQDLNNPGWSSKVHLDPLVSRVVSYCPSAPVVTNLLTIKASEPGSMVFVKTWRSADLVVSDSPILHSKNLITSNA